VAYQKPACGKSPVVQPPLQNVRTLIRVITSRVVYKESAIQRRWRARRQRARIHLHHAVPDPHSVGYELFGEWRRCAAVHKSVLIAVPRAGYATVDDAAFAERAVLMRTEVGQSTDVFAVAKDCNALTAGRSDDARALVGDRGREWLIPY
jgi:hypothetical protein